jgi:predicted acetyltransferase
MGPPHRIHSGAAPRAWRTRRAPGALRAYDAGMVSLTRATKNDEIALQNLMQLYIHDWSELRPLEVGDDGRFREYPLAPYLAGETGHAFLIQVAEQLGGFVLVGTGSRLTGAADVFDMAEFFVLRRHRRSGVGRAAASATFDSFSGPWEVRQRDENPTATAFWRRVISTYTDDHYEESRWHDSGGTGVVQRFTTVRSAPEAS